MTGTLFQVHATSRKYGAFNWGLEGKRDFRIAPPEILSCHPLREAGFQVPHDAPMFKGRRQMRKLIMAISATAMVLPASMAIPTAAQAQRYHRYSDNNGYYNGPTWRGRDGRYYCRRSNGTTGLIVGAAGGALIGRAIDTHGERTTGTVLGAVAGALVGRSIERHSDRGRRCR
jgi:hypothetical protein